jgi:hypothetical protein
MNLISLSQNFARILLLSTALVVSISTAIAGGRSGDRNLMDDYLQSKTSVNSSASSAFSQQSTLINNNALVFNRGATSVDNDDFDKKFSPEREASCALFCKSIFTKPLVFESTLSVFSKLFRSCALELFVVAIKHSPCCLNQHSHCRRTLW